MECTKASFTPSEQWTASKKCPNHLLAFFRDVIGQRNQQRLIQEVAAKGAYRMPNWSALKEPVRCHSWLSLMPATSVAPTRGETDCLQVCHVGCEMQRTGTSGRISSAPIVKSSKGKREVCDAISPTGDHSPWNGRYIRNHWLREMDTEIADHHLYGKRR